MSKYSLPPSPSPSLHLHADGDLTVIKACAGALQLPSTPTRKRSARQWEDENRVRKPSSFHSLISPGNSIVCIMTKTLQPPFVFTTPARAQCSSVPHLEPHRALSSPRICRGKLVTVCKSED
ncbi:hypothetical protein TIFTF001_035156 [Ficus carica]|uniref:Uncharacterized protein n=1 Tax=Ficus carica TaxID=3494 RepID=A0AA88E138_FICCA|nr:hypothetical protein TIFTF001_035156 [Ficus carica]